MKNNIYWLLLNFLTNQAAIKLKNPVSSSAIDNKDTQMNNTNIVNGLKLELVEMASISLVLSNKLKIRGRLMKKIKLKIFMKTDTLILIMILIQKLILPNIYRKVL